MLQCECGFTCGTVKGYAAHLARFSGAELARHQLVPSSDDPAPSRKKAVGSPRQAARPKSPPPSAPRKATQKVPELKLEPEQEQPAKRPQTRSWMKMLSQAVDPSRTFSPSRSLRRRSSRGSSVGSPRSTAKGAGGDVGSNPGSPCPSPRIKEEAALGAAAPDVEERRSRGHRAAMAAPGSPAAGSPSKEGSAAGGSGAVVEKPRDRPGFAAEWDGTDSGSEDEEPAREEDVEVELVREKGSEEEAEQLPVSDKLPPLVQEGEEPVVSGPRADGRSYAVRQLANTASLASVMGIAGLKGLCSMASRVSGIDFESPNLPALKPVSIAAAADTLLWKDGWLSLRVFGMGVYMLICLQQLVSGGIALQPSTLMSTAALLFLAWNLVRNQVDGGRSQRVEDRELQLQEAVTNGLFKVAISVIPLVGAVAGLVMSGLSGRKLGPTMWCGAATSFILMVGELQIVGQMTLLMLVWVGAFTLPWLYMQCQHALDAVVEEAVDLAAMLLSLHSRPVLIAAGAAGIFAGASTAASGLAVCVMSAAAASGGMLWYNHFRVVGSLAIRDGAYSPENAEQTRTQVVGRALPGAMDDLD